LRTSLKVLLLHGACGLLVLLYINTFQLWAWLVARLGETAHRIPGVVVALSLAAIFGSLFRRYRNQAIHLPLFQAGVAACLLAALLPDPEIPIKRIHVPEYLLLSLLVRYTLSLRTRGPSLLWFTALVTALYGIHDEVIQGLHPLRTYGLTDMSVNAISSLGGSFLGESVGLFKRGDGAATPESLPAGFRSRLIRNGVLLAAAVLWMVIPLAGYKGSQNIPWQGVIPLIALLFFCGGGDCITAAPVHMRHGMRSVGLLALLLVIYPFLVNLTPITFF